MTQALKVLGQSTPAATTLTDLYTVGALKSASCSSLVVCNQNAAPITFRLSVAVAGAADNAKQYLYYDTTVNPNDSMRIVIGISLATTDVVRVYASGTGVSFNLFGVELS